MFLLDESRPDHAREAIFSVVHGRWWTYGELASDVLRAAQELHSARKGLAFCFAANDIGSVIAYLAAIEAGHTVALLDRKLPTVDRSVLQELYRPEFLLDGPAQSGILGTAHGSAYEPGGELPGAASVWRRIDPDKAEIHQDLTLMLTTSGSTGSPKLVRLSRANVASNAISIRDALDIGHDDRAITSLPIYYSYGLSVLNSHLAAGARVVLTDESVIAPAFWNVFREHRCTSLAGVPYTYQMLDRVGATRFVLPSLHTMTQAGGKLSDELILRFHRAMSTRGGRFEVMYGQTEATARIACLPSRLLPKKLGSVGFAIPGGRLWVELDGESTSAPERRGEVVYSGPNVMMGYATRREDLSQGDHLCGVLRTGDLGYFDDDGCLRLAGRSKRIAKVFGVRLNLDEVEDKLRQYGPTAVVEGDEKLLVFCEHGDEHMFTRYRSELAKSLRLHRTAFEFRKVRSLPRTASGKTDYPRLLSV